MNTPLRSLFILVFALLLTNTAFAGDPIPGVDVRLTNTATGAVVHTRTDASGAFSISLDAGTYTVCLAYADCVKAATAQASSDAGRASGAADTRSYTSGKFMLEIDGMRALSVTEVSPSGIRESPTLSTGSVAVRESPSKASLGKQLRGPIAITKDWTNSDPGCQLTVASGEGKKDFKGHVTLMK